MAERPPAGIFGDPAQSPTPRSTLQWLLRQLAEHRVGANPDTLHVWMNAISAVLRKRPEGDPEVRLNLTSLVSHQDGVGRVELNVAGPAGEITLQLDPPQVHNLVLELLSAAEAARADSFLYRFATDGMRLPPAQAATLMDQARKYRDREARAASALEWKPTGGKDGN